MSLEDFAEKPIPPQEIADRLRTILEGDIRNFLDCPIADNQVHVEASCRAYRDAWIKAKAAK